MSRNRWIAVVFGLALAVALASPSLLSKASDILETRVSVLETRVNDLEATVAAMSEDQAPADESNASHTITGEYIEQPEVVAGSECANFYDAGTTVFLSDTDGDLLGTSELSAGTVTPEGKCSQTFEFTDIPDSDVYVFNVDRRVIGSTYEFTRGDVEQNGWHIVVVSRYRP